MDYIFLAGIHGVGKTTLAQKLESELNINSLSISELIRKAGKDINESDKKTNNISQNQELWKVELKRLDISEGILILDGHFCLLDKRQNIVSLPFTTFDGTKMTKIVLMQKDPQEIRENLLQRDTEDYTIDFLQRFQEVERYQAMQYAKTNNISLFIYDASVEFSRLVDFITNQDIL